MTIANVFISDSKLVGMSSEIYTLYDYLIPSLAKQVGGDFADEAQANLMCEYISLSELDKDDFSFAFDLVMTACDKEERLMPYKESLEKAFKADPRFNSQAK